jgi:hypothetical protein
MPNLKSAVTKALFARGHLSPISRAPAFAAFYGLRHPQRKRIEPVEPGFFDSDGVRKEEAGAHNIGPYRSSLVQNDGAKPVPAALLCLCRHPDRATTGSDSGSGGHVPMGVGN